MILYVIMLFQLDMPLEELEANWKFWVGEIEGKRNVPKIGKVNLFFVSATAFMQGPMCRNILVLRAFLLVKSLM